MGSTKVKLVYEGKTITQAEDEPRVGTYMLDTAGDLLMLEYNDNAEGQVDDLEIVLRNREGLWLSEWRPKIGAKLRASILPAFDKGELVIGDMFIDDFEAEGPEGIVKIRATSVPVDRDLRGTKKTRAWESLTFEQMAKKIADEAGLSLYYQGDPIEIERTDQHEEKDLELLKRLADDYGYVLKVSDSKIVLYDQEILEAAEPVAVVDAQKGDGLSCKWRIHEQAHGIYRAARVMYRNTINKLVTEALKNLPKKPPKEPVYEPLKPRGKHRRLTEAQRKAKEQARQEKHDAAFEKEMDRYLDQLTRQAVDEDRKAQAEEVVEVDDHEFFYSPEGAPLVGGVLEIETRAKDIDEAKRIAERKLRDANKKAIELRVDLVGDIAMRASQNIMLVRAGDYSGKYHIDQANHRVEGSGYRSSFTAHRVLEYR